MKPTRYIVGEGITGICKSPAVWIAEGNGCAPLFYIKRPKWIKDDKAWRQILSSITIKLPQNIEIK